MPTHTLNIRAKFYLNSSSKLLRRHAQHFLDLAVIVIYDLWL